MDTTSESLSTAKSCSVCYDDENPMIKLGCGDSFCSDCVCKYVAGKVSEGAVGEEQLVCMNPYCKQAISVDDIKANTVDETYRKYKEFFFNRQVLKDPNTFWCVRPSCMSVVRSNGKSTAQCGDCGSKICTSCSSASHPWRTCEQAVDRNFGRWEKSNDVTRCPSCTISIQKNGGCQHMTCRNCRHEFCWSCLMPWSKHSSKLCTFLSSPIWGRTRSTQAFTTVVLGPIAVGLGLGVGAAVAATAVAVGAIGVSVIVVASPAALVVRGMRRRAQRRRYDVATNTDIVRLARGIVVMLHDGEGEDQQHSARELLRRIVEHQQAPGAGGGRWLAPVEDQSGYMAYAMVAGVSTLVTFRLASVVGDDAPAAADGITVLHVSAGGGRGDIEGVHGGEALPTAPVGEGAGELLFRDVIAPQFPVALAAVASR